MDTPWLSYIPDHVAQDILLHPQESPIGREQRFDTVALFADVSGFTPMSEALGKIGRSGTEEVTTILNSYFTLMIELIRSYGGVVGKFGGDSMTVLFLYTATDQGVVVRRAIQCALQMQANMTRYAALSTSAGTFGLTMKAGLAMGSVFCTSVGDPAIRLEYIIAGEVLDICADAEHHSTSGEVVVHRDLLAYAGGMEIAEERGDFRKVARLSGEAPTPLPSPPRAQPPQAAVETVARYLHPIIAERLRVGQVGFINEHRDVTVLFVSFSGFDYDHHPAVGAKLQQYFNEVVRIIQRFDGYLNKIDMGDKGSKYVILFGTPVAHEDDEERALRCALDLRALPAGNAQIGINTGFVYCGQVGSTLRQEYTVMGDVVNLSARLMQAAQPGEIIISGFTHERAVGAFLWQHREPIQAKGKAGLIPIYVLQGVKEQAAVYLNEPVYSLPLVGRERELDVVRDKITQVLQQQGQIVGISGEAGMGKSRLNVEIIKLAVGSGCVGYAGECQSYNTHLRYIVWQGVWRGFFGIDPFWSAEAQIQHLEKQLAAFNPAWVQRLPLLGAVLNLSIPDNSLTQSLDAPLRTELLHSLLLDCLQIRARQTPLLLVLEDCQWMDDASRELLLYLGRNLANLPVLLVALYRPPESADMHPIPPLLYFTELALSEFTAAESEQLIRLKLEQLFGAGSQIPAGFVERIMARAQGNPFYTEELMNYIKDRGVRLEDADTLQLPASLNNLIISRIDLLAEDEKTALKIASVLGRLFKARWVWESHPQVGAPDTVRQHFLRLSQIELTPLNTPDPELEYLFKHVITREVIYESLAYNTRATLHNQVGQYIERVYGDHLAPYLDMLAYHYGRSLNIEKQREYFRRAGDAAAKSYANAAATDYYQRLLPLLAESERGEIMCASGDIHVLTGMWAEAEALYRQALALAEQADDRMARARCQNALGYLFSQTGAYPESLTWLEQARMAFEGLDDRTGISRALEYLSLVYLRLGDHARALAMCEQQLQFATEQRDWRSICEVHMRRAWAYIDQGNFSLAQTNIEQALAIAAEIGYRQGIINAYSDLAGMYIAQGDYASTLNYCQDALAVANEIGYRQRAGHIVLNMGEVYRYQGEYANALDAYGQALHVFLELGDLPAMFVVAGNVASVYIAQRRTSDAEPVNNRAIAMGRQLNIPFVLCEFLYNQAVLHLLQQRYSDAQPFNVEALEVANQVGHREFQLKAQILAIRLRVLQHQLNSSDAIRELEQLQPESDAEQAALHYEIWRLDNTREESRQIAARHYRTLFGGTPNIEFRERYQELTGDTLSAPPPLPPVPELVAQQELDLQTLLSRV